MEVNFSEYNQVHLRRAEHLVSFVKGLNHAMQKTEDYEGAMHQLKCVGFDDDFIQAMCQVAHDYKEYHKDRIKAEQTANLPENLYPFIQKDRVEQFAENRKLILALQKHDDFDALMEQISDAFAEELEVNANTFLLAYMTGDVDLMVSSLVGWNLEALMAKAKIIPDTKNYFYQSGDFPVSDIAFPFFGKKTISEAEFKEYLRASFTISREAWAMIDNAFEFAKRGFTTDDAAADFLWSMLESTVGVSEEIVRMVKL